MTRTSVLIEAAMQILSIAQREENLILLKGRPLNRCPDEWIEKEYRHGFHYSITGERDRLAEEMTLRKNFGIKIIEVKEENNEVKS